jgi:GDP-4-dehydro-6-deoxy-D-mannose reductase
MRALITGSRGFVGRWLRRHLRSLGDEVVELPEGLDIRDRAAVLSWWEREGQDLEACYHLAAQASVAHSFEDPEATWEVNALGTVHVVEALARFSPQATLLYVSTSEVYGAPRPEELPVHEDAPLRPRSPYASSKVAAEAAALEGYFGRGLRVVVARPFNHLGPGQGPDFVVPSVLRRVREALADGSGTIVVGNLDARRDFADVREVVAAYRALVERGRAGGIYNVSTGRSYAIREVLELILEALPRRLEVVVDPSLLRPADIPELVGDPSRLAADTGVRLGRPLRSTLEELISVEVVPTSTPSGGGDD